MEQILLEKKTYGLGQNGAYIYEIPEIQGINLEWFGNPTTEEFKEVLLIVYGYLKEKGCVNWLANSKNLGTMSEATDEWVRKVFTPMLQETAIKKVAVVMPEDFFAHFSITDLSEKIQAEGEPGALPTVSQTQYFGDINSAFRWLAKKDG